MKTHLHNIQFLYWIVLSKKVSTPLSLLCHALNYQRLLPIEHINYFFPTSCCWEDKLVKFILHVFLYQACAANNLYKNYNFQIFCQFFSFDWIYVSPRYQSIKQINIEGSILIWPLYCPLNLVGIISKDANPQKGWYHRTVDLSHVYIWLDLS